MPAQHRALSLIEVVASLALLATTATVLLFAQGRSLDQLRATRDQEAATDLAREWLADWKLQAEGQKSSLPLDGQFGSHPAWHWRRQVTPYLSAEPSRLVEMQLSVFQTDGRGRSKLVAAFHWIEKTHEP